MTDVARSRAALVIAVVVLLTGCSAGDDRPLKYLQTLPEDALAYPEATLTCTTGQPEKPFLDDPGSATSTHCYTARASESTVVAWYAEELALRGWRRQDRHFSEGPAMPEWRKGFAIVQIRTVNVDDKRDPSRFEFTVALVATNSTLDMAPVPVLLALPESELRYPGSKAVQDSTMGRSIGSNSARPAMVQRLAETPAAIAEVEQYFDRELLARGWRVVDSPTTDMRFGWNPQLAWQKGAVMAGLVATRIHSGTTTFYQFAIAEVLGPDETPGVPWE